MPRRRTLNRLISGTEQRQDPVPYVPAADWTKCTRQVQAQAQARAQASAQPTTYPNRRRSASYAHKLRSFSQLKYRLSEIVFEASSAGEVDEARKYRRVLRAVNMRIEGLRRNPRSVDDRLFGHYMEVLFRCHSLAVREWVGDMRERRRALEREREREREEEEETDGEAAFFGEED